MNNDRVRRLVGLSAAIKLCERLDAAEQDVRKARAAFLIAYNEISRLRLKSQIAPGRRKGS